MGNNSLFLFPTIGCLIVFFICVYPRFKKPYYGVDTWRILLITDYLRKYKKFPKFLSEQYIIQGPFDHPVTLSLILSLFSKETVLKYQFIVSPIIEAFHAVLLFIFTYYITGDVHVAFIAQIIYGLTGMVVIESSQLSSRSFGTLNFTMALLPLLLYQATHNIPYLIVGISFLAVLCYSHRMSIQVVLLFSLLVICYSFDFLYLCSLCTAMIVALAYKGYYWNILKGQIILIRLWWKHIDKRYAHQVRGVAKSIGKHTDFVRKIESIFTKIPVFPLLLPNPWFVFVIFGCMVVFIDNKYFLPIETVINNVVPKYIFTLMAEWAIGVFLLAIMTATIKKLRFIGSGERYLEYCVFPTAFLASIIIFAIYHGLNKKYTILFEAIMVFFVIFACILPIVYTQYHTIIKDTNRSVTTALFKVFDFINALTDAEVRIACIPHQLADSVLYFTKAKVLLTDSNTGNKEILALWWPEIKKPIEEVLKKYAIDYLLLNKNYVTVEELNLSSCTKVFEADQYLFMKLS